MPSSIIKKWPVHEFISGVRYGHNSVPDFKLPTIIWSAVALW